MVILNAKIADNLALMRFLVDSKVGNHMAVNGCKICFAIEPFFPQNVCIGPLWNKYIPLYMDCVIQIIKGPYGTTNVLDKSIWLLMNSYRPLRIV